MFKIFLQKRQRNAVGDLQAVKSCVVVCPENKDIFFFVFGNRRRFMRREDAHTHQPEKSKEII